MQLSSRSSLVSRACRYRIGLLLLFALALLELGSLAFTLTKGLWATSRHATSIELEAAVRTLPEPPPKA